MSFIGMSFPKERSSVSPYALLIGFLILFFDLLSKFLVVHFLPLLDRFSFSYPYGGIGVFKNWWGIEFSINHVTNRGAAWGLFGEYQEILLIGRVFLIGCIFFYLFFLNTKSSWVLPLVLIVFGAIGNIVDYFFYGHVIDMLHFVLWGYNFPVFNIADAAISLGVGCLFILFYLEPSS